MRGGMGDYFFPRDLDTALGFGLWYVPELLKKDLMAALLKSV
jgi:hypothetical protein